MNKIFEKYKHHGNEVFVRKDLKGKHRDFCLCFRCKNFNIDVREENCYIANIIYDTCVKYKLVLPVWECPVFEKKKENIKCIHCDGKGWYWEQLEKNLNFLPTGNFGRIGNEIK